MSHVVGIDLQIRSLEAVKRTCKELGLTLKENQTNFRWFGRWVNDYAAKDAAYKLGIKPEDYGKCEHAIEVPGSSYDIGLCRSPKGEGLVPVFDFFGTGQVISKALGGNDVPKFRQIYTANAAELEMEGAGYMTAREWDNQGNLDVVVTEPY